MPERDAVAAQLRQPYVIWRVWIEAEKLTGDLPESATVVNAGQNQYLEPQIKILTYI
jgi:hypothetical protein